MGLRQRLRDLGSGSASTTRPAGSPALRSVHGQVVHGHYKAGRTPVIFSPVQTKNRWSQSTLVHEQTHQDLTINTAYGALCQVMERAGTLRGFETLAALCAEGQWGVQEGVATYVQMAHVAVTDPDGLDAAISLLPSADLGQEPYLEWFERLTSVLPLEPTHDAASARTVALYADIALALGVCAMNSDVLSRFRDPARLDERSLRAHLDTDGPGVRLERLLARLGRPGALDPLVKGLAQRRDAQQRGRSSAEPLDWLTRELASLDKGGTYLDNAARMAQTKAFYQSWMPATPVSQAQRGAPPLPEVRYTEDWEERFPEAFPDETLTLDVLRRQLAAADRRSSGLALSIAMVKPKEVHLTAMAYPLGSNLNPRSWESVLALVNSGPDTRSGVFPTARVLDVLQQHPNAGVWVDFVQESWRPWDRAAAGRPVLRRTVQTCTEHELTVAVVTRLVKFRRIERNPHYALFLVHGQQYAACLFDPDRLGCYGMQSVQGEAGLHLFSQIARRTGIAAYAGPFLDLPHATLLRLAGQGLLL